MYFKYVDFLLLISISPSHHPRHHIIELAILTGIFPMVIQSVFIFRINPIQPPWMGRIFQDLHLVTGAQHRGSAVSVCGLFRVCPVSGTLSFMDICTDSFHQSVSTIVIIQRWHSCIFTKFKYIQKKHDRIIKRIECVCRIQCQMLRAFLFLYTSHTIKKKQYLKK